MHSPFRHTALPQTTTFLLAAQGHDLTDNWSLPSANFVDSWCLFQCSFGCVLLLNQMFWKQCTVQQCTPIIYLINLLWKLGLAFGLDTLLHCFCIFHGE